jgi:tetratricopeptide (TPR) repeat protein
MSTTAVVDEVILIASGSENNMDRIARGFGAQLVIQNDDFNGAWNKCLEMATGDWILFLYADEELTAESGTALRRIVEDDSIGGYFIRMETYWGDVLEQKIGSDIAFRLFRNRSDYRFSEKISEQMMDVIIERNRQAKYSIAEDVAIFHYEYLAADRGEKVAVSRKYLNLLTEQVIEKPDDQRLRYHYGLELYRLENYEQAALELIKAADDLDCQTSYLPRLLHYIVLAYYVDKKYSSALNCISQGLTFFPDYADLYYYQGLSYYGQQEYGLAYAAFNQALATSDQPESYVEFAGVRGFRSYYFLGQIAEVFYNQEEALDNYILALRDKPIFTAALDCIIRILQPRQNPSCAKAALARICEFPSPQAYRCLAQLLFNQGAYQLAADYFAMIIQKGEESADIKLQQAICFMQQGNFVDAIGKLDSIGADQELYEEAKFNKLFCFWLQGSQEKLRFLYEEIRSLNLSEDYRNVVFLLKNNLGYRNFARLVLGKTGIVLLLNIIKRTFAFGEWERALTLLDGVASETFQAMTLAVGELCFSYGNMGLAEQYLNTHIDKNSQSGAAYFILAQIKEQQEMYFDAQCCYRKSLSLNPKNPQCTIKLIHLYKKMRQAAIAETVEKYPEITNLQLLLAAVSDEVG